MATNIPNISDGIWDDLKAVLEYMVVKNNLAATENETEESKRNAQIYFSAVHRRGSIISYSDYLTYDMFKSVMVMESPEFVQKCLENPVLTPREYRPAIIQLAEDAVINGFVEKNNYYRMLLGLPPFGTPVSEYLFLEDTTYEEYGIKKITADGIVRYPAIHELDDITQEIVEKSNDFQNLKAAHPEAEWLGYIGQNKIPLEQARNAKEFEIIRLFPNMDPTINRELVVHFSNEYNRARLWFTKVMWNADLEQTSIHYRQYIALAIVIKALRMTLNRQFDGIIENNFLNDTLVTILFDLYRLPQSLNKLPVENRRRLALELRKLIRDRASNKVLYDVARILGFDNIIISKIVLNKIQLFEGENQEAVHAQISNVRDPLTGTPLPVDDPYHSFMRQTQAIDIMSPNQHDDIIRQKHVKDYVREVTGPDPRWWEDNDETATDGIFPETEDGFLRNDADAIKKKEFNPQMFKEPIFGNPDRDLPTSDEKSDKYDEVYWGINEETRRHPSWYLPGYNSVDTKYLMLTYHYSMADKMFEMIYLMRYLLDKKTETERYKLSLPVHGGKDPHSIYNIVLFLVCGLNRLMFGPWGPPETYKNNTYGEIINNNMDYHRIIGYNVDLTGKEIMEYLDRCSYLDKNIIKGYIEETTLLEQKDIPSAYAIGILGLRDYLITQMELAQTITQWRECEKFYYMIFTYDPVRDIHSKDRIPPNPDDEYVVPDIRYKIYDMEVSDFGGATGSIGDPVRITVQTSLVNVVKSHTIVVGFVSKVENGIVTEVNFRAPKDLSDYFATPVWNNPMYNTPDSTNLISDVDFDKGDLYNPSGTNGPDIEEGSYLATIGNGKASGGMYIRVTTTRYHTRNLYETYLDELVARDEWLANYIRGNYTDQQMAERLNEACDVLGEAIDVDLNFIRNELNGGENMEIYLMDMIKYIKSYTIDFITSEKAYILNDKRNPEWLKIIDALEFDPKRPVTMMAFSPLMIYDAIREETVGVTIFDGKPYPKDEWDLDPFKKGSPHITDAIRFYYDEDRPNVTYHYRVTSLRILEFTLPQGLTRGTKLVDQFTIKSHEGPDTFIKVEIYLGTNPTPGEGTHSYYHYSGFNYKTDEVSVEPIPIQVCIQENKLPIDLAPNVIPDYGKISHSDNGYFIGISECDYTRRDINNPQYRA